jgi:hypothetical protein
MVTDNLDAKDKELEKVRKDLIEARHLLHAMFDEHCWVNPLLGDKPIYDIADNSIHEEVQNYLIRVGLIQSEECVRRDETEEE